MTNRNYYLEAQMLTDDIDHEALCLQEYMHDTSPDISIDPMPSAMYWLGRIAAQARDLRDLIDLMHENPTVTDNAEHL